MVYDGIMSKLIIVSMTLLVVAVVMLFVISLNREMEQKRCVRFAQLNPTYEIKNDRILGCIIKIDGLWISTYNLRDE